MQGIRLIPAEEFFGGKRNSGGQQRSRTRGKESEEDKDLFSKVKVEMVMRIYGCSRDRALQIIADRENELRAANNEGAAEHASRDDDEFEFEELFTE